MVREAEELFGFIAHNSPVGIYFIQDDRFLYVNPALARIFGYEPEELVDKVNPLDLVHPKDRNLVRAKIQQRLRGEVVHVHYEFRGVRKNGEVVYCEVFGSRMEMDGEPVIVGTLLDITRRKETEERLLWELGVKTAITGISRIMVSLSSTIEDIAEVVLDKARAITGSPHGFASVIDPSTEEEVRIVVTRAAKGCGMPVEEKVAFAKRDGRYPGLWGHALNTGIPFYTNMPQAHPSYRGIPKGHIPIKSFMAVPAVLGNKILGQVALANAPQGYTERDLEAVERLVDLYALAIERELEVEAIKESEDKYKTLAEASLTGIFIQQDGKYVFVNRRFAEIHGYTVEELLGKDYLELVYPGDREKVEAIVHKRLEGKGVPREYEVRRLTKDGRVVWCRMLATRINYQGKPAIMGNIIDISDLKVLESELKASLERLKRTLEGTIKAFASAVEKRDPYTAGHQRRVAQLARALALEMGLDKDRVDGVYMAGLVHDIGKISIPGDILTKPGRLTPLEFELIKDHPVVGYEILKEIDFPWPVAEVVLQHHERLDGSGYPQGLKNGEILPEARIVAVADVVEAMSSHRPYRPALGVEAALEEIKKGSGVLYDSQVVQACARLFEEKGFTFDQ